MQMFRYQLRRPHFRGAGVYKIALENGGLLPLSVDSNGFFEIHPQHPVNLFHIADPAPPDICKVAALNDT